MLGHADITTTAAHYLETKKKPLVELGHLLPGLMENPSTPHRARRARFSTY
jgi:hypothetical protein